MFLWFEISQGEVIYVNTQHIVTIELSTLPKEEVIVVLSDERTLFISLESNCEQLKKLGVKF